MRSQRNALSRDGFCTLFSILGCSTHGVVIHNNADDTFVILFLGSLQSLTFPGSSSVKRELAMMSYKSLGLHEPGIEATLESAQRDTAEPSSVAVATSLSCDDQPSTAMLHEPPWLLAESDSETCNEHRLQPA
eukprot:6141864-Amphidinium_carterae.2